MASVKAALKEAGWTFVISRIVIMMLSFLVVSIIPSRGSLSAANCFTSPRSCVFGWLHFDVLSYIYIAVSGYGTETSTAFFPLWPLLLHVVGAPLGPSVHLYYLIGIVLANILFYLSLVLLYLLTVELFDHTIARKALIYLAFAPYALFFFIGYTESLFLVLCLATFFCLQRAAKYGNLVYWWSAGLCGLLAALTRSQGFLLSVPFIVVFAQRYLVASKIQLTAWREKMMALLPILLIPLGVLIYMGYLWYAKGDPLLFSKAEAVDWNRAFRYPWVGIHDALHALFVPGPLQISNAINISSFFVSAIILGSNWKRLPLHYALFAMVLIIFPLCYPIGTIDALSAIPRYMLIVFPVVIISASWKQQRLATLCLAVSLALFTFNVMLFICHYWVA
ncbi:mannosyltransferase family protein [Dictyobacter aurantiacus]|nr:mannosyltransferase family protein [Dictyobacter aurantiacus]